MDNKIDEANPPGRKATTEEKIALEDSTVYPSSQDIYNKFEKEEDIDPEDISKIKEIDDDEAIRDLDIPGSELDDEQEDIGSEDEENNYYSLGGDNHDDLEEAKGE
jgi:hypothetical protein